MAVEFGADIADQGAQGGQGGGELVLEGAAVGLVEVAALPADQGDGRTIRDGLGDHLVQHAVQARAGGQLLGRVGWRRGLRGELGQAQQLLAEEGVFARIVPI